MHIRAELAGGFDLAPFPPSLISLKEHPFIQYLEVLTPWPDSSEEYPAIL